MPSHGREIPIELRAAVAPCRILYREKFEEIERKTGVNYKTAAEIMRRVIGRAGSKDFYEVLACLGDLNRPGRDTRVVDGTQLSATISLFIVQNVLIFTCCGAAKQACPPLCPIRKVSHFWAIRVFHSLMLISLA